MDTHPLGLAIWITLRLNVCVPEILVLKTNPYVMVLGGGDFGRLSGRESRALMNGIIALMKEAPEISFAPSTCEVIVRSGSPPDTKSAGALILGFLAPVL